MIRLVKKYLKGIAVLAALLAPCMMFIEVFMDLMQPRLLSDIIDVGIANQDLDYVYATGGKMLLMACIGFLGGAGCSIFSSIASSEMATKLRQGLFDKIQTFSFREIDQFKASSLITRLTNDVTQVQNMLGMVLRGAIRSPLLCIGGIIMAIASSPRLSVIFLMVVPLIILFTVILLKKSFPLFVKVQEKIDRMNTVMRESILGIRVIKALTLESSERKKFDEANEDFMERSIRAQNMNMMLWPIVTLLMNLSVVGVLWFGGNMVNEGSLEIGKIMAFVNYLLQITGSLIMMVTMILNFSRAKASADRINEVLGVTPAIVDCPAAQPLRGTAIEFKNVSFRYNEHGDNVLDHVSFMIREGEKVGIIGSTGSGKSSLVHLIPRLYDATEGQVLIGGIDVKDLKLEELRNNIGLVLQESILFAGTIEDNLRFGNKTADEALMEEAVQKAQAYDFVMEKENKYQSIVEQRGKNFSGGQKQRLSIARTLIKNPRILILDDSTSALDVTTESRLQQAIRQNRKASTVIIIAQRISGVMDADKIIVLDHGRIASMGSHKDLLETCEIYRTIAVSQLGEEVLHIA